jgi:hypothetical protein
MRSVLMLVAAGTIITLDARGMVRNRVRDPTRSDLPIIKLTDDRLVFPMVPAI